MVVTLPSNLLYEEKKSTISGQGTTERSAPR